MALARQTKPTNAAPTTTSAAPRHRAGSSGTVGLKGAPAAIHGDHGIAQAKVTIGKPNDRYETEADQVAEHVMRGGSAAPISRIPPGGLKAQREADEEAQTHAVQREDDDEAQTLAVQREEDDEAQTLAVQREEDDEAQTLAVQREEDDEAQTLSVQRKADPDLDEKRRMQSEAAQAIRTKGPGDPLVPDVRAPLERGLGADLGEVRVHEGGEAASRAKSLKAHAFTHKNHVWLGPGQSQRNLRLMAHETTHVLQQGAVVRRKPNTENVDPGLLTDAGGGADSARALGKADTAGAGGEAAPVAAGGGGPASTGAAGSGGGEGAANAAGGDKAAGSTGEGQGQGQGKAAAGKAGSAGAGKEGAKGGKRGGEGGDAAGGGAAGTKGGAEFGGELEIKRPQTPNSDANAKQRLDQVMDNVETTQTEQKGPAASPDAQSAASEGASSDAASATPVAEGETEQAGQIGKIDGMEANSETPGKVDQTSFKALVKQKLADMDTPGSPEEMEKFGENGGAAELRAGVVGDVKSQSDGAQSAIRGATEAAPEIPPAREVAPLPEPAPPPAQRDMQSAKVLPPPKSKAETALAPEREAVDARMKKEKLSDERLAKANDPRFSGLGESKNEVHKNANTAPGKFKAQEQALLVENKGAVNEEEQKQGAAMATANAMSKSKIGGSQQGAMSRDEAKRAEVAKEINKIYSNTETDVKTKLDWLSGEVDRQFDAGEKKARDEFENYVATELRNWKIKRYGSRAMIPVIGVLVAAGTWAYDKLKGISEFPEVKAIFDHGRQKYLKGLETMIEGIATTVDDTLAWCKTEIKKGKKAVQEYVKGLDDSLKDFAKKTTEEVFAKFDDLGAEVDAKKEELADHLVQRYKESRDAINARIEEMKAENAGLIEAFIGKLKAVLEALDNFRKKLMSLMSQAAEVIELILEDPIGFLSNLIKAVKLGFEKFAKNIWEHLKQGIFGWLFGAFASMGINIPKEFSIKSIVGFILEVLGVTWERIRPKIVRVVGERNVAILEKVFGYMKTLFTEGPKGLWEEIKDDLSSLKDTVMDAIKEWVISKIVTAAVSKIVSMFNPAGAIVQAIMAIYNVVMFFVERIDQIMALVQSIISSLSKIVKGDVGQAAAFVEKTMALTLPIIISFLARLIGLGGVAKKIKGVISKVQKKVSRAIDKAIKKIVARMKKLFGKDGKGKKSGPEADAEKRKKEAGKVVNAAMSRGIRKSDLKKLLVSLKKKFSLKKAELTPGDDVVLVNSPPSTFKGKKSVDMSLEDETRPKQGGGTKTQRVKKPGGSVATVGQFHSSASNTNTLRGALKPVFSRIGLKPGQEADAINKLVPFPAADVPSKAPRPDKAVGELYGIMKGSGSWERKSTMTGRVADLGRAEKFVETGGNPSGRFDGGHLIGHQYGGPDTWRNLVPMRSSAVNVGVFAKIENFVESNTPAFDPNAAAETKTTMTIWPSYGSPVVAPVSSVLRGIKAYLGKRAGRTDAEETTDTGESAKGIAEERYQTAKRLQSEAAENADLGTIRLARRIPSSLKVKVDLHGIGKADIPDPHQKEGKSKDTTAETKVKDYAIILEGGKKPIKGSSKAELDNHKAALPEGKKVKFSTSFTVSGN